MSKHTGAIITVTSSGLTSGRSFLSPSQDQLRETTFPFGWDESPALYEILGESVVERLCRRLGSAGVEAISVLREPLTAGTEVWESTLEAYVEKGMDRMVFARLGAYHDVNFSEFLEFHEKSSEAVTQAYQGKAPLELVALSTASLKRDGELFAEQLATGLRKASHYAYRGCLNDLQTPADLRKLAQDALVGRCELTPAGQEVRSGVWLGSGARVDDSTEIVGPAYIGANTRIRGSCRVSGASSIERNCEIDMNTNVDQCCVMAGTYLGVGLHARRSIVGDGKLFHLDRGVQLDPKDDRLIGGTSTKVLNKVLSYFSTNPPLNRNSASNTVFGT